MIVKTNNELSQAINTIIQESGMKKIYIAEQMGIANQNLNKHINKNKISLDEANQVLKVMGYNAKIIIEKD